MPTRIEKDEKTGKYVAIVSLVGREDQRYYGDSHEELTNKLLKAQEHATMTIDRQKLMLKTTPAGQPDRIQPRNDFKPKPITAQERAALAERIKDPANGEAALNQAVEAQSADLKTELEKMREEVERQRVRAEANEFMRLTPEYWPSPENEALMIKFLEAGNYAFTVRNLTLAYEDLHGSGLLKAKPSNGNGQPPAAETETTEAKVVTRPRLASTGMPGGRSSSAGVRTQAVKLTRDELLRMPFTEYDRRMKSDPAFVKAVNELGPAASPQPTT